MPYRQSDYSRIGACSTPVDRVAARTKYRGVPYTPLGRVLPPTERELAAEQRKREVLDRIRKAEESIRNMGRVQAKPKPTPKVALRPATRIVVPYRKLRLRNSIRLHNMRVLRLMLSKPETARFFMVRLR